MKRILLLLPILLLALSACMPAFAEDGAKWQGVYRLTCYDAAGNVKWHEDSHNALANEGQQEILAVYLQGTTAPSGYAIGLSSMTFAKTTTYATITGEPSGNGYARQTINRDATASGWPTLALDTGDFKATAKMVTFTATGAVGPVTSAFLVSSTTNKLVSYTALSTSRTLAAGDTLQVTYSVKQQ